MQHRDKQGSFGTIKLILKNVKFSLFKHWYDLHILW